MVVKINLNFNILNRYSGSSTYIFTTRHLLTYHANIIAIFYLPFLQVN